MMAASAGEDGDTWEEAEGVPRIDDPFIAKYLQGRDALVAEEKKQRSDWRFRQSLSPIAAEAAAIVSQIRFEEQQTLWTKEFEDSLAGGEQDIYPGMMFSLAKERMEGSKLWKIIRRMPKGALLHCHLEAMVSLEWLVQEAFDTEGMHIQSATALSTAEARLQAPFYFSYKPSSPTVEQSIWDAEYNSNAPIPISQAAESFPDGGRAGFVKWLISRCSITPEEALKQHQGPNQIWRKFQSTFPILNTIIYYEPIFRKFIRKMCQQLLDDGVRYVDVRAAFVFKYWRESSETPEEDYTEMLRALQEEVQDFMKVTEGKFAGLRMIWTMLRGADTRAMIENMKQCVRMKKAFPQLIAGYDVVGYEDLGRSLQDLTPELFWFRKHCAENGVDIPFFFHAAETLGDGTEADENLFDAILLGTRRIGHGFTLYRHPLLIDMVKEKRILVESCPVSNEILRLTGSIMSHPLPALIARGVPAALCNDDPAILGQGSTGTTHDFWQALQGWDNLGLPGLGALAENSVRWASYEDCSAKEWLKQVKEGALGTGIRAQRLKEWMGDWERFCQWVVTEYGVDEDLEPEE